MLVVGGVWLPEGNETLSLLAGAGEVPQARFISAAAIVFIYAGEA